MTILSEDITNDTKQVRETAVILPFVKELSEPRAHSITRFLCKQQTLWAADGISDLINKTPRFELFESEIKLIVS